MKKVLRFVISVAVCQLVAFAGSSVTIPSIADWYPSINKPSFTPLNWVFAPVWTILFLLMGIALFLVWEKGLKKKKVRIAMVIFSIQLLFNFLWSLIFFALHQPLLAFINIVILWLAILFTILKFKEISKPAAYLLLPYFLWVSFASILNFFIVKLN